jgi:hypothetical protein
LQAATRPALLSASALAAMPRGCLPELEALLADLGVRLDLHDERSDGEPLAVTSGGVLSGTQQIAVRSMLSHDIGVLCAPSGWGKTVAAASLIAARGCSTLVLVHRRPLVEHGPSGSRNSPTFHPTPSARSEVEESAQRPA